MTRRTLPALSLVAVTGLALAGCAASGSEAGAADDGAVSVVASTSVYADLASSVFGDAADVSAIVDSASVDPHGYEATAQDQLAVTEADLAVYNGGGYDAYMEQLVEAGDVEHSIMAVEYNHDYPDAEVDDHDHADDTDDSAEHHDDAADDADDADDATDADDHDADDATDDHDDHDHNHVEGFNEHVWYDPHTMIHVVEAIAEEASELVPDDADSSAENADDLIAQLEGLEADLADIEEGYAGRTVAFTEPVGGYLTAAAGLEDVTVDGFAEAVEAGQEVPPATMLEATTALESGEVDVFVVNPQTAGPETDAVVAAAEKGGVPIVEFTETIPDGEDYVTWMQGNVDALAAALDD